MKTTDLVSYPVSPRGDHVDVYRDAAGADVRVPDPYRWLENPDSPETRAWVQAQSRLTEAYLAGLPAREAYRDRIRALWDAPGEGAPWKRGGRYFRHFNPGLLNQPLLQVADAPRGPWRTLLDPNALSADGTVALAGVSVSPEGQRLAYGTQSGGSDWVTWRVRDVPSGEDLPDVLEWSKFGGASWLPDETAFYYSAYDAPEAGEALTGTNRNQRLMLHRVGTAQAQDEVALQRPDEPDWGFHARVTRDGAYLVVHVWKGTANRNQLWVRPLHGSAEFQELVGDFRASFGVLGNDGPLFYLQTNEGAPRDKVIAWNIETGVRRDLIPEGPDALEMSALVPGGLLLVTLKDASHRLTLYSREGDRPREVRLPALGAIEALNAREDDPDVFLTFTSFLSRTAPYRLAVTGGDLECLSSEPGAFDASKFEVTQEFAVSRDGTRIPMFIVAPRGLKRDGTNPTLLYGYGGFNIALKPGFSAARLAWVERGGVFVQANLRGGGEYGRDWHEAGTLKRKQNVFDDFIACAEHLIRTGVTSPAHLGIHGRSNGGLLVGACLTQRPELYGAAIPQVGVLDMLRYHNFTIGWAWASDYGRSDDPQLFEYLRGYSPLHALRETAYPPTLIVTGDHDDRVVPGHSFKFGAQLQHVQQGDNPTLLRLETRGGHGAGKPTTLAIEEWADIFTFLDHHLR